MGSSNLRHAVVLTVPLYCFCVLALAQQPSSPEKKPPLETPEARLANAKSVLVIHARGNVIPYDVIRSTVEGWIRLTVVESAEKADLIIEVATTGTSDTRVSSSDSPSMLTGHPERSSSTSKDLSNSEITMTVYDAKNRRVLWTASQTAKSALKQTTRENNLVEAAEKLASKFHDRLEPPLPKAQD